MSAQRRSLSLSLSYSLACALLRTHDVLTALLSLLCCLFRCLILCYRVLLSAPLLCVVPVRACTYFSLSLACARALYGPELLLCRGTST
ncbi:unspecified product [Leishmania tarentolae]|uniref:Unspecified product n=1 Tax=Leishmania tarentolae TaxID=5689 RepID=A0A640KNZ2_LEITA|nr:unspecified product [Leishmania tarentolae]